MTSSGEHLMAAPRLAESRLRSTRGKGCACLRRSSRFLNHFKVVCDNGAKIMRSNTVVAGTS
jgi:hypothetical protein